MLRVAPDLLQLVDGVEGHLCKSAPRKARALLHDLRDTIRTRSQRSASRAVSRVLDSQPYFRGARRRFLRAFYQPLLKTLAEVEELLREIGPILDAWEGTFQAQPPPP